jgi:lactate dehydrogenase-like 2-hydroxyacid dehydrogenase
MEMKVKTLIGTALTGAAGVAAGMGYEFIKEEKRLDKMEDSTKKQLTFYNLLIAWLELKQEGRELSEYFEFNNIKTIAVYGMKELGERLVRELKGSGIEIKYIIDKNIDNIDTSLPKYKPDDTLEEVDAVVVTAVYYYQDIEETLSKKMDCQIISLEDVVYGLI